MDQRRTRKAFVFLALFAFAALLGGCGGSSKETMDPATGEVLSASTPTVGVGVCVNCHTRTASDWMTTKHANTDGNLFYPGSPTTGLVQAGGAACIACHDPNGDSGNLTPGYTGNVARPVIGCESCHGPGSLHADAGGAGPISLVSNTTPSTWGGGVRVSGQFAMCTNCHELLDKTTGGVKSSPTHSTAPAPTGSQYVITDTHSATSGSFAGVKNANLYDITGYSMDFSNERVCVECHNPHKNAEINREWAKSKHADTKKAGAWAHYNWSCTATDCGSATADRRTCQRCHTTTGFSAYATALQNGNAALADSIWKGQVSLAGLEYSIGFKPEMLECKGCHADNSGTLRNPGAYKAAYKHPAGGFPSTAPILVDMSHQYPDIGASNVCMPCHTGRTSGKAINKLNTGQTAVVSFASYSYVDGHYLTAGGTMFKGTGYEYGERSYTDPGTFMHKQIGTSAPGTGTMGPCIGCHMDRTGMPGNHLFEPVSTGTGSMIVTSPVCFECHANSSIELGRIVQDEKDNYEFGLEALEHQLLVSTPSYSFTTSNPYFDYANWLIFGDTDTTGNSGGKNTMGAAFNFSLLHHEPGAYVHNSRYVKRLIYDSIDWIDDGQMNYSVGSTLNIICSAPTPSTWCSGAKSYLLYGAAGTTGERP